MTNDILNTIVLTVVLAAVVGFGVYVTQKKQPAEMARLEQEETALQLRQAEISELLVEEAGSRELAEEALRRWNARYKVLPDHLSSPDVVNYLNALSAVGFKNFDIAYEGTQRQRTFSRLSYSINGTGYFYSLYRFIWNVENGRGLYHVRNLTVDGIAVATPNPETGIERREELVTFSMTVDAYFGGSEGMSAPDSIIEVPDYVLPAREPANDLFWPLILDGLPPNTDQLVEVENDALISVVGDVAVFRSDLGPRPVREGDPVYLGEITRIDPNDGVVVADLNKGGIRERVEIRLATGERYRQALGAHRLAPLGRPAPMPAPPQPGTPEARRANAAATAAATAADRP
ncbi:MAG: hypothetical protein R3362_00590 [Rhodothermales bacterium]|nr:hypothetical protein [Rhodothermales bacterium]